jgi:hypothetical protein
MPDVSGSVVDCETLTLVSIRALIIFSQSTPVEYHVNLGIGDLVWVADSEHLPITGPEVEFTIFGG